MAGKDENRIFVGGLSWDVNERQLENAFCRFGKIIDSQVLLILSSNLSFFFFTSSFSFDCLAALNSFLLDRLIG